MKARRFLAGTFSQAVRADVQGDAAVIWGKERRERCRCAALPTCVSVVRSMGRHSNITYRVLRLTSPPTDVTLLLYLPAKCRFACLLLCWQFPVRGNCWFRSGGSMPGDCVKYDRILDLPPFHIPDQMCVIVHSRKAWTGFNAFPLRAITQGNRYSIWGTYPFGTLIFVRNCVIYKTACLDD